MQDETEKIIEEYISKAPEVIRNFIASGEWKIGVDLIAKRFSLEETKINDLKNEIIFVLIGMEPKSDFTENIKRELEIDSNIAGWIAEDVDKNIFANVSDEINSMWQTGEQEKVEENSPQNNIGNSFEQIILNQAKAMRPAMPAGEVPHNLPGAGQPEQEKPKAIHNYMTNDDPYREPIQ